MANDVAVRYCLDSNAVSDILRRRTDVVEKFEAALQNDSGIYIPSIVYYELERGFKASGAFHRLREFYVLYEMASHLFLDRTDLKAIEKAADIYAELHKGRQIEDNDVYIAAIAMVNDCTLVTANTRHFSRVHGLKIVNWRD